MTTYQPDLKAERAFEIINSEPQTEREELLIYYITEQQYLISEYQEKLRKYGEFFTQLSSFLPSSNPILR